MKYTVLNQDGIKVFDTTEQEIKRMVRDGKVIRLPGSVGSRSYKLTGKGESHPCRTRISSGGVLAAIGLSQRYTSSERGKVNGFKTIYPEDAAAFRNLEVVQKAAAAGNAKIFAAFEVKAFGACFFTGST